LCKICDNAARIKGSVKDLGNIKCKQSEMRSICLCSTTIPVLLEQTIPKIIETIPKIIDDSYIFTALETNKYIYRNVYMFKTLLK
jgi:hypothetical protein